MPQQPPSGQQPPAQPAQPKVNLSRLQQAAALLAQEGINLELILRNNELQKALHERDKQSTFRGIVITGVLVTSIVCLVAGFGIYPKHSFLPTQNAHAVCDVKPLSEPFISDGQATQFAIDMIIDGYTFDFLNYKKQLSDTADKYMTPSFRDKFINLFGNSNTLQSVIKGQYAVQGQSNERAIISGRGIDPKTNTFYWDIDVPFDVYYKSGANSSRQQMIGTVRVVRSAPSPQNNRGVAADNVIIKQRNS